MDVVQWLTRRPAEDAVAVCFAPAWADRLPKSATLPALRRRSAPLVSRHLSRPLAVAVPLDHVDDDRACGVPGAPGLVSLRITLAVDGGDAILPVDGDDVRFAAILGEYIGVVADLCEAAGLPLMGALPDEERRGLVVILGGLAGFSRARLGDGLLLFASGVRICALARGFDAVVSVVVEGRRPIAVDGRIEEHL